MSTLLFMFAAAAAFGGCLIAGLAKKGEQETLGGAVILIAVVLAALGALAKVAGL